MRVDWERKTPSTRFGIRNGILFSDYLLLPFSIVFLMKSNPRSGKKSTSCIKLCNPPHCNLALVQSNVSVTKVFYVHTAHVALIFRHTQLFSI